MTYEEREAIFAKDVMSVSEYAMLRNVDKCTASTEMTAIRESLKHPRCSKRGYLDVQDYIDHFRLDMRRCGGSREEK